MTVGCPASLYDVDNPDWAPTQHMGTNKVKSFQPKLTLIDNNIIYSGKPTSQGVFFRRSLRNYIYTKIIR